MHGKSQNLISDFKGSNFFSRNFNNSDYARFVFTDERNKLLCKVDFPLSLIARLMNIAHTEIPGIGNSFYILNSIQASEMPHRSSVLPFQTLPVYHDATSSTSFLIVLFFYQHRKHLFEFSIYLCLYSQAMKLYAIQP